MSSRLHTLTSVSKFAAVNNHILQNMLILFMLCFFVLTTVNQSTSLNVLKTKSYQLN